ncbi:GIY-YIG nuclease family protein [Sunxiuqinia dokdonensis]|uniref:GIY-YIG nuclease n=1 Tax=Sunxiuqinia dokdonensis TaxID=1409788 RepID=A0A0L8VFA8_9BACT|nr:GIY-YIG nuclease family protein [Sunxiuqinia dokdonensis]KOH47134.1 GIY-YIG nuclease [Sunxiuqinia dokdonensis]
MTTFYVYILANKPNGVLYVGMTNELERRIAEHKGKQIRGFTHKYNIDKLVYFEEFETYDEAFQRERQMKKWKRDWKIEIIENKNPEWKDLANNWY